VGVEETRGGARIHPLTVWNSKPPRPPAELPAGGPQATTRVATLITKSTLPACLYSLATCNIGPLTIDRVRDPPTPHKLRRHAAPSSRRLCNVGTCVAPAIWARSCIASLGSARVAAHANLQNTRRDARRSRGRLVHAAFRYSSVRRSRNSGRALESTAGINERSARRPNAQQQ
jgi:hypothetical protein